MRTSPPLPTRISRKKTSKSRQKEDFLQNDGSGSEGEYLFSSVWAVFIDSAAFAQ
jgi:hypothetical protein